MLATRMALKFAAFAIRMASRSLSSWRQYQKAFNDGDTRVPRKNGGRPLTPWTTKRSTSCSKTSVITHDQAAFEILEE